MGADETRHRRTQVLNHCVLLSLKEGELRPREGEKLSPSPASGLFPAQLPQPDSLLSPPNLPRASLELTVAWPHPWPAAPAQRGCVHISWRLSSLQELRQQSAVTVRAEQRLPKGRKQQEPLSRGADPALRC